MAKLMIICDLEYQEELIEENSEENSIVGGVSAYANTSAFASSGSGYAKGDAVAVAQSTYTQTRTSTTVSQGFTDSQAQAYAYAKTGKNYARGESDSFALFIGY